MDKQTLEELSALCRIRTTPEENARFEKDFASILDYFKQLDEIDTGDIEPLDHVVGGIHNVFREDEVKPGLNRKTFLDNAPSQIGGMVRVPLVIKDK
jgi:aspartyl-tRNA(Asn)/glutamyl-tRNA(Gln) amidotransferase subunit C